jgi:DNA-binding response OmpR family regulator
MIAGLTVLVVDRDPHARAALVDGLRRLGMHAFGAFAPVDALALLDGIEAELVVVRAGDPDVAVRVLGSRTLVVEVAARAGVEESLAAVRAALGEPASGQPAN